MSPRKKMNQSKPLRLRRQGWCLRRDARVEETATIMLLLRFRLFYNRRASAYHDHRLARLELWGLAEAVSGNFNRHNTGVAVRAEVQIRPGDCYFSASAPWEPPEIADNRPNLPSLVRENIPDPAGTVARCAD